MSKNIEKTAPSQKEKTNDPNQQADEGIAPASVKSGSSGHEQSHAERALSQVRNRHGAPLAQFSMLKTMYEKEMWKDLGHGSMRELLEAVGRDLNSTADDVMDKLDGKVNKPKAYTKKKKAVPTKSTTEQAVIGGKEPDGQTSPSNASPTKSVEDADLQKMANDIMSSFRKSADALIEAGLKLLDAKEKLGEHGQYGPLLKLIGISRGKASRLTKIAKNSALVNSMNSSNLPGTEETLLLLSRLDEEDVSASIEAQTIHPSMSIKDAKTLLEEKGVAEKTNDAEVAPEDWLAKREGGLQKWWKDCPSSARKDFCEVLRKFVTELEASI